MDALLCTHCEVRLESRSYSAVSYHRCPSCARTYASTYDEAFRHRAGVRRVPERVMSAEQDAQFARLKSRLESFLRRIDSSAQTEPHFVLGVRAGARADEIKARYRELAMRHHPDRGGDPEQMRRVNEAYRQLRPAAG